MWLFFQLAVNGVMAFSLAEGNDNETFLNVSHSPPPSRLLSPPSELADIEWQSDGSDKGRIWTQIDSALLHYVKTILCVFL